MWLLLLLACREGTIGTRDNAPTAEITSHEDGAPVPEGVAVQFRGVVADIDDGLAELDVTWRVDDAPACTDGPDPSGQVVCVLTLDATATSVSLEVRDPFGAVGVDTIAVAVTSNTAPTAVITGPSPADRTYADHAVTLTGTVADAEDAAASLSAAWFDGTTPLGTPLTPDAGGLVEVTTLLAEGAHVLVLRVTDTQGDVGEATLALEVGGPNQAPTCDISQPSQTVHRAGLPVLFRGTASDPEVAATALDAQWTSDVDGLLGSGAPASSGSLALSVQNLSTGPHTVTLTVTDEVGASCTDTVAIVVTSPPTLEITAPASGTVVNVGEAVVVRATVADDLDRPDHVGLVWASSRDGVLSTASATSGGAAVASLDLTRGAHLLTVTATDTAGLTASDDVTVTVNGAPGAPTIAILPASADTTDDLTAVVVTPAADPDGNGLTYGWSWSKGGIPQGFASPSVPASATARGQTWSVTATPNDGFTDGPAGSASLVIGNAPPTLDSASIGPASPRSDATLTATAAGFSDPDGDPATYTYTWLVNGVPIENTGATLGPARHARGQEIRVRVQAADGHGGQSAPVTSLAVPILNGLPSAAGVDLAPAQPRPAQDLHASVVGWADPDGDAPGATYRWWVDGALVAGVTGPDLDGAHVVPNGDVTVELTPFDGYEAGTAVTRTVHVSALVDCGGGTLGVPIATCDDLADVAAAPGETWCLTRDVDCDGVPFAPIPSFSGVLLGNGHAIDALTATSLFGTLSGEVIDLWIVDASARDGILATSITGTARVIDVLVEGWVTGGDGPAGGVAATAAAGAVLSGVTSLVDVEAAAEAGGLLGLSTGAALEDVSATGDVVGGGDTGGLVGRMSGGTLVRGEATGPVSGTGDAGGLIGEVAAATVDQSRATGAVVSSGGTAGGLVGRNQGTLTDVYATGGTRANTGQAGGLVGNNQGTVGRGYAIGTSDGATTGGLVAAKGASATATDAFWDLATTAEASSQGGTGRLTKEMLVQGGFLAWDFDDVWRNDEGRTFPCLLWESGDCPPSPGVLVLQPGPDDGKDIWTTSYYSYRHSGGPGGGLNDERLRAGGWGDTYESLMAFDLDGWPTQATQVLLEMYRYAPSGDTAFYLDRITAHWDWTDPTLNPNAYADYTRLWWANKPPATAWQGPIATTAVGTWKAVDITTLYNDWQSGALPNHGLLMRPQGTNNQYFEFWSSDYLADPLLRPRLVITP